MVVVFITKACNNDMEVLFIKTVVFATVGNKLQYFQWFNHPFS
jgi:hypothetical protein